MISRRHFNSTIAAGAAYAAFNPVGAAGMPADASLQRADDELCELNAVELAARLARKQVSAREVMSSFVTSPITPAMRRSSASGRSG